MYTTGDSQFAVGLVVGGRCPTLTVSFCFDAASIYDWSVWFMLFGETRTDVAFKLTHVTVRHPGPGIIPVLVVIDST
jgi:hypothetical protein